MNEASVWVVDDDSSIRWVLEKLFQKAEISVQLFSSGDAMLQEFTQNSPDLIITDIRMPGIDGVNLLKEIQRQQPELPVIIMTAHSNMESAVASYEGGAFEYLPKPFDIDEMLNLAKRALEKSISSKLKASQNSAQDIQNNSRASELIGESAAMQDLFRTIGRLSNSSMSVLISGASGSGKERVAQALHNHSPRTSQPFIALNMAAVPKELMDSELFGHKKGAFTGATESRKGRFQQADGGTLFLDEIGDMPLETQTRLLRVLSEGEFYQVGGHAPLKVDVRIVAATHQNLNTAIKEGRFREDLYHRLNVIHISVPTLAERSEDIPLLSDYFLHRAANKLNVEEKILLPETISYLKNLSWTGNVRQLENTCRWITVMAPSQQVRIDDLPPELQKEGSSVKNSTSTEGGSDWESALRQYLNSLSEDQCAEKMQQTIPTVESILIEAALEKRGGKIQDAAKLLGWGRNTLSRKMRGL
ncbi:MAG: nitrogen regulation protein NR(I), partial [Thiotrichales bacterium]|jgi:two-component system nitrogen regulation response regulator GlnG|nr:nitrogen regulation protein NR(I) [Thiotrichales bacterium]MBT4971309.1 nitrogen regulation protein NR(I) [Thiotrichales bacterium]MBT5290857.1 nitrogen regulation protein NR(I) [Thiotrichales bacterium]MBT6617935.1 nitrogen regulation protein NR(I) [Thiotrichales bacterium]MBT7006687.1 nitrogen regulation protein NR(I) [Thiotrichales bacterium]